MLAFSLRAVSCRSIPASAWAGPPRVAHESGFPQRPRNKFPGSRVTYFGGSNFMKVQSWAVFISASPLPA